MEIWSIRIDGIRPNYRLICDEDVIVYLCNDIRRHGQQEPIMVELEEHWFRIIDGEKRWRACKKIGLDSIRAAILEASLR